MTAKSRRRERLGRWSGLFGGRQTVYAVDDGVEVDELDGYEVTRRRVFWEDVLLVTYHRKIGVAFPVFTVLAAALFGLMAFGIGTANPTAGAVIAAIFCTPFIVALGLRLALGVDVVTVFGRRTMARMRFSFLKARARRTFDMIIDRARRAQDQIARRYANEDAARAASDTASPPAAGGPAPLAAAPAASGASAPAAPASSPSSPASLPSAFEPPPLPTSEDEPLAPDPA